MIQQRVVYSSLDTPAVLVDMDKLEANIREMSRGAAEAELKLRPHTKIHECPEIAKMQVNGGAVGISVAKLAQAENMAKAGINDIMVVHPFYGKHKLEQLKRLLNRQNLKLSIVVDMIEQAKAISRVALAVGKEVPVLLKIDIGLGRFGVLPGEPALRMARRLCQVPAIKFAGILTHETTHDERTALGVDRKAFEVASVMAQTAKMLRSEGIVLQDVITGASSTFHATCRYKKYFPEITEIHPGGMVIGDLAHMYPSFTEDTIALTVLTTVVSTPAPDRAIIDGGGKTFSKDTLAYLSWNPDYFLNGKPSYGRVKGRPDLWVGKLSTEVGTIFSTNGKTNITIGDRLEILPNHAGVVTSMHDEIYGVRQGVIEKTFRVGRGLDT